MEQHIKAITKLDLIERFYCKLPLELRIGLGIALGLAILGFIFDRMDVTPLEGFWVHQPIDFSILASAIVSAVIFGGRLFVTYLTGHMRGLLEIHTKEEEAIVARLEGKVDTILSFLRGHE